MIVNDIDSGIVEAAMVHGWTLACLLGRFGPWCFWIPLGSPGCFPWRLRMVLALMILIGLVPMAEEFVSLGERVPSSIEPLVMECLLGMMAMIATTALLRGMSSVASAVLAQTAWGAVGRSDEGEDSSNGSPAMLMHWLAVAIFFVIGGDRLLAAVCIESLERTPIGSMELDAAWIQQSMSLVAAAWELGLKACLPLAMLLLLSNLLGAVAMRIHPWLGQAVFGPSSNGLLMLAVLSISVGGMGWLFQDQFYLWIEQVFLMSSR